jgi:hypothetical protein
MLKYEAEDNLVNCKYDSVRAVSLDGVSQSLNQSNHKSTQRIKKTT